ncbi:MAG: transposase DNA-binding-containing protein [Firmicutes bacterium]|nr:transposase DNA-binding-containing protein [Bacillota bacterium]
MNTPAASIPQACGTWAQTQAAYRFVDHPRATPAAILAPHRAEKVQRTAKYPVILAVQDTTVFQCTRHRHTPGVGPMGHAGLSGLFLHSCLAVSPEGVPLGLLGGTT